MNLPFPFDEPLATAFYTILLVLTFAMHQAFMHYVLAGSLYVAWASLFPGSNRQPTNSVILVLPRNERPLALILRDWMPFILSAAITAGVAPLLFIQIVYQRQFYTANLLLSWRWMILVPVLIIAFYLLYLVKSQKMARWPRMLRGLIALFTAGCFVFVGFCWTVNHQLGMSESKWADIYLSGELPIVGTQILSRMLLWISGSFATMAAIVAWQFRFHQQRQTELLATEKPRQLAFVALVGIGLLIVAGILTYAQSDAASQNLLSTARIAPWLILAIIGLAIQAAGWLVQCWLSEFHGRLLSAITAGALSTLLGISFLREAIRASTIGVSSEYARHVEATKVGGFGVFLFFTVVVTLVIAWCFRLVSQGLKAGAGQSH